MMCIGDQVNSSNYDKRINPYLDEYKEVFFKKKKASYPINRRQYEAYGEWHKTNKSKIKWH